MRLKKIIENLREIKKIKGKTSIDIRGLACDSKAVKEGYIFIAIKGLCFNGEDFIDEAINRGAHAVILESQDNKLHSFRRGVTFIYVNSARKSLSEASRAFFGDLSSKMRLIGVTGTNGKTTTIYLLESLFKIKKEQTGVIGTINYRFGNRLIPALNTTPSALDLYSFLDSMYRENIKNCILEVSSHSLEQGRVDTLDFDIAIFTNLTKEHLDYHHNLENYFASKMKLFTKIKKGGYAVINKDTPYSERILKELNSNKNINIITYGVSKDSDVYSEDIKLSFEGLKFGLCANNDSVSIDSHLIGRYNVHNILASASCGIAMGMDLDQIKLAIENITALPGRLEKIDCGQDFSVFVDYAHTENGLENALTSLRELKPNYLLTVFGCGGDRDKLKRPDMGKVSSDLSDKIFITTDNPRNEEPMDIINQIIEGIDKKKNNYVVEADRFNAINKALREAKKGDIVLIAGKGHETYQVFKNVTLPFDDREVIKKILKEDVASLVRKTK